MKLAAVVVAVLGARFFTSAIAQPSLDGDLRWQMWSGTMIRAARALPRRLGSETFTAAGAPWTPHEWLFSIGASLATTPLAWAMFAGAMAACAGIALVLVAIGARRRGAAPATVAVATACAGAALLGSFGVRAQVLAWPLAAALLLCLDLGGGWLVAAVGIAALWSNLHGSAVLAPLVIAVSAAGAYIDGGWNARTRSLALTSVAAAAAILANPLGWHLVTYAFALVFDPLTRAIVEWRPSTLQDAVWTFGALPLFAAVLVAIAAGASVSWSDRLRVGLFVLLGAHALRNVPLCAIAVAPIAAAAATAAAQRRAWRGLLRAGALTGTRGTVFALGVGAGGCIVVAAALLTGRSALVLQPAAAGSALARAGSVHVLCEDYAWCSVFLGTRARVFLDGRCDPYPRDVWDDYLAIIRLAPGWERRLRTRQVDAVLSRPGSSLARAMKARGWIVAGADATAVALVRPDRVLRDR